MKIHTKLKFRFVAGIMAAAMTFSLLQPCHIQKANAETTTKILDTDITEPSEDCTFFGVYGSYFSQAQDALDFINKIRKEACEEGNVPDPRNPSRMLTASDYSPLKWSRDLESIARIRAVEGGLSYRFQNSGHDRLTDKNTYSVSYNGHTSQGEVLAYTESKNMVEGATLWYMEKQYWVGSNPYNQETGHYTNLIDPDYKYIGLGGFYTDASYYSSTLAGELSTENDLAETMQEAPENVIQKVEVSNAYIDSYYLDGGNTVAPNESLTLTPRVQLKRYNSIRQLWVLNADTFTSSDSSIATVSNNGVVTGVKNGTVTITAKSQGTTLASKKITVMCHHTKTLVSTTPATCTTPGEQTYYCEVCKENIHQTLPVKVHDYVYGDADSTGKSTGVCSMCGDSITIVPPDYFALYWYRGDKSSNDTFNRLDENYTVGTRITCSIYDVSGQNGYTDMIMESSDPTVVSVPSPEEINQTTKEIPLSLNSDGIATLSLYPKYNPRDVRKYTIRVGETGSINISDNTLSLSETNFTYTGFPCKPQVTLTTPQGFTLEEGTDYTVTYNNFMNPGTATVVITGMGLFSGTISKEYTITKETASTHTHVIKTVSKVEPTCENAGSSMYYYCTECGKLFSDPNGTVEITQKDVSIAPLGHDWDDDYTIDIAPTKETDGEKSIHCSRCNTRTSITTIPATGNGSDNNSGNSDNNNNNNNNNNNSNKDTNSNKDKTPTKVTYPTKGKSFTKNGLKYKITSVNKKTKYYTVSCMGSSSKKIKKLSIPDQVSYSGFSFKVTAIAKKAFYKYAKLQTVSTGNKVTSIGSYAFSQCPVLKSVTIGKNTKKIDSYGFYKCKKLSAIKINSSLLTKNSIGKKAFVSIKKKAKVRVPSKKKKSYKKWFKSKGLIIL